MKVSVLPGDHGGCGQYRITWPAHAVAGIRPDWQIKHLQPRGEVRVGIDRNGAVVEVQGLGDPDVLVMQRTGTRVLAGIAEWAQRQGIAVVVDFDDAMWCISKDNQAWKAWNAPSGIKQQHWRWCDHVAERADLVTVTTSGLAARYGSHGRVEIIANRVPQIALDEPSWRDRYDPELTIGWAGFTATHPGDCAVSAPAARAAADMGLRRRVVADPVGVAREWGVGVDPVGSQDVPAYYGALGSMDLMLVGLKDTPFNRCKSTLKVLEAGAAGVPSIASATQPHRGLRRAGFPVVLADSPEDWKQWIYKWATDSALRRDWSAEIKQLMPGYTIEANAEYWAQAWERAARRAGR